MDTKEKVCVSVLLYFLGEMLTVIALAACDFRKVSVRVDAGDIKEFFWFSLVWPVMALAVGVHFTTYWLKCAGRALRRIFVKDKKGDKE